jgi:hypothetical protein
VLDLVRVPVCAAALECRVELVTLDVLKLSLLPRLQSLAVRTSLRMVVPTKHQLRWEVRTRLHVSLEGQTVPLEEAQNGAGKTQQFLDSPLTDSAIGLT